MSEPEPATRPLSVWESLACFVIPTILMWLATRLGIPLLRREFAGSDVLCWFVAGGTVFFSLFVAAFAAFWLDQRCAGPVSFAQRFRFRRISRSDLLWSFSVFITCGICSATILLLWIAASTRFVLLPRPEASPSFMQMEPIARKTIWILAAWLPLFFFNIAGEELWWRGYLLPRQEQTHGKKAWIVHGFGLGLFHLPLGVHVTIIVLPFLFGLPFLVQKQRNIWTGFIVHGTLNGFGFLAVAFGLA